jgi:hypothetical protein
VDCGEWKKKINKKEKTCENGKKKCEKKICRKATVFSSCILEWG